MTKKNKVIVIAIAAIILAVFAVKFAFQNVSADSIPSEDLIAEATTKETVAVTEPLETIPETEPTEETTAPTEAAEEEEEEYWEPVGDVATEGFESLFADNDDHKTPTTDVVVEAVPETQPTLPSLPPVETKPEETKPVLTHVPATSDKMEHWISADGRFFLDENGLVEVFEFELILTPPTEAPTEPMEETTPDVNDRQVIEVQKGGILYIYDSECTEPWMSEDGLTIRLPYGYYNG